MDAQTILLIVVLVGILITIFRISRSGKAKHTLDTTKLRGEVEHIKEDAHTNGQIHEIKRRVEDVPRKIEEIKRAQNLEKLDENYERTAKAANRG